MTETRKSARQNHLALAQRVLAIAMERGMRPGDHLAEQAFAEACGVSRTPIRSCLKLLSDNRFLEWRPEEGYFLTVGSPDELAQAMQTLEESENMLASRILADRSERRIGEVQSVSALARRYDAPRSAVLNSLKILSHDGIVTQLPGRAWAFQPTVDSPRAMEESFSFRLAMEPLAISQPGFALDIKRAAFIRGQTDELLGADERSISITGFARVDMEFHTLIAESTGNRFLRSSLMAHHRLRAVSQKGSSAPNFRLRQSLLEHIDILESLERNEFDLAAEQMVVHLRKSYTRRPETANRGSHPLTRGPRN